MAEIFEEPPKTEGRYIPLGQAELLDHTDRRLRLRVASTTVEVTALTPDLLRVGMFPEGRPPRYDPEAIAKEDWEPVAVKMSGEEEITVSTDAAMARVSLDPLRISFADPSGREFAADDRELGMGVVELPEADVFSAPLGRPVRLYKRREDGERFSAAGSGPAASRRQARTRSSGTSIRP